ncbi:MAG: flavin reductase family protein [Hyphomicrobiales bacterium]
MTVITPIQSTLSESVSKDQFRDAMSRVGSAVHIVTTAGVAGTAGLTVTAFSAVSDAPPIVLVCINRSSRSNETLKRNGTFCVNILSADHQEMADLFAGRLSKDPDQDRFSGLKTDKTLSGAPVLPGCLATLDCRLQSVSEVGTHSVLFGAVQSIVTGPHGPGLIYRDRGYHAL